MSIASLDECTQKVTVAIHLSLKFSTEMTKNFPKSQV